MKRNPDFVARDVGQELVLVPVAGDSADLKNVYALNEVAAHIWRMLETSASQEEIADGLCEMYDVEREEALADTRELLDHLREIGAVIDD